jgi:alkylated DNA repair dioxygenase AlkB
MAAHAPAPFAALAHAAAAQAGFQDLDPDACLINRYVPGGPARLRFHGVAPVKVGEHDRVGVQRINLTFRRAA